MMPSNQRSDPAARLAAALPDAVTATFFLCVWLMPTLLGESALRNAVLVMLVEFLLVHASGFLGGMMLDPAIARARRLLALVGFSVFYLVLLAGFMLVFREWWPLLAFSWLLLGKFAVVIGRDPVGEERRHQMRSAWALSVLFYIGGAMLTVWLPVPRLGITEAVRRQADLSGGGLWVDQPERVVAFGLLYFGLTAWSKWRQWQLPRS